MPHDQAYVAEKLEEQLTARQFVSPDIAQMWSEEIDRRITAYDRGDVHTIEFDKSLDHLRQAIAEHRGRPAST